jgi:hypothetical protein
MRHIETKVFSERVSLMDAKVVQLIAECELLARAIEERMLANIDLKPYERKSIKALENRIKSRYKRIQGICAERQRLYTDLSLFSWSELRDMLCESEGHVWNERQRELGNKEREDYEGKFEDSYRDYNGWPLGASLDCADFPDGSEGKYLAGQEATFRVGKVGKRIFGSLLKSIAREFNEDAMTEEQWNTMFSGEVSTNKLCHSFPEAIRLRMQNELSADKVLNVYPAMVFLTDVGFFVITREDYAKALSLTSVSQMSPRYRIKREYVEQRILAQSASK